MNLTIEQMLDDGTEGAAWGMTPNGNPVLVAWKAGKKARIEFTAAEAKDVACGGIYTATYLEQQKLAARGAGAAASIVAPDGRPMSKGH
jgi:hypothetical protein